MARVLCLHGLGGTGATMWPLVAAVSGARHTVLAPTLPGHGSRPENLVGIEWATWMTAARAWPADVIVGQSMGAALALGVAAEGGPMAVVAINPPAQDPDALEGLAWRRSRGQEWISDIAVVPGDVAYDRLPISALIAMWTGVMAIDLGAIRQPLLLVTSINDEVVDPAGSDAVAAAVTGPVQRLVLARSGHVATLDVEREEMSDAILAFVDGL